MWMNYKYPELMVFPIKPRGKFHQCLSSIDNICNEMECSEAFSSYIYICMHCNALSYGYYMFWTPLSV